MRLLTPEMLDEMVKTLPYLPVKKSDVPMRVWYGRDLVTAGPSDPTRREFLIYWRPVDYMLGGEKFTAWEPIDKLAYVCYDKANRIRTLLRRFDPTPVSGD